VAYFFGGAVFHGKSCLSVTKKIPDALSHKSY
jgi:hypothetical protein